MYFLKMYPDCKTTHNKYGGVIKKARKKKLKMLQKLYRNTFSHFLHLCDAFWGESVLEY